MWVRYTKNVLADEFYAGSYTGSATFTMNADTVEVTDVDNLTPHQLFDLVQDPGFVKIERM